MPSVPGPMAGRERPAGVRGSIFRDQEPLRISHPDLDGWEPVLGPLYGEPGTHAHVVDVRPADEVGDIEGRAWRVARLVLTDPCGVSRETTQSYRPANAGDGPDGLAALGATFRSLLEADDLQGVASGIMAQLGKEGRLGALLQEPANLRSASARRAFWLYQMLEPRLAGLEQEFADHKLGAYLANSIRSMVLDAYRVGRWARESELAPQLQATIDYGRGTKGTRRKIAESVGLGQDKGPEADARWRTKARKIAEAMWRDDPDVLPDDVVTALREREVTKGDIKLPKKADRIRLQVAKWLRAPKEGERRA